MVHAIDPDGAPLPGVMVVVTGPVGSQTQYTGVAGEARFPGLYPGDGYSATFTLDGFTTVIRDELTVVTGRIIDFTVTMDLATVEETITVTGESPLVDVKSTSVAGLVTSDLLDRTPTASGIWAGVMDKIPGVSQVSTLAVVTPVSSKSTLLGVLSGGTIATTSTVVTPLTRQRSVRPPVISQLVLLRKYRFRWPLRTSRSRRLV